MTVADRGRRGQWKVGEVAVEEGATTTKEGVVGGVATSSRRLETTMLGRGYGKEGMVGNDEGGFGRKVRAAGSNSEIGATLAEEEEMKRRRKQGVRRAVAAADVGDDKGNG
ncbi:hypothetical protein B296_00046371 [Ensete ventricosum]|uniref:DUF834 domain-containing protein n=1 Tax=Ensete ventricosum TaxID=4639 RepID=A0A426XWM4_ENSVE|nr:hypothetical protein B296_00046371 [Ensete ventricosum]